MDKSLLEEFKPLDQFINWDCIEKNGKKITSPVNAGGELINYNDPKTWLSYEGAVNNSTKIGFVLTDTDPYFVIVLDHVLKDGKLCDWATKLVAELPSTYIEQSDDELYIVYRTDATPVLPNNKDAYAYGTAIEVYVGEKYIPITGNVYSNHTVSEANIDEIKVILRKLKDPQLNPYVATNKISSTNDSDIDAMNQEFAVIKIGNKVKILHESINATDGTQFSLISKQGFTLLNQNKPKVQRNGAFIPIDSYWLNHPDRRQLKGIVFHPKTTPDGYYNTYQGFAVKPIQGDIDFFLNFCREVICNNNGELYAYLIAWMADLVQSPEVKPGVALVIRGLKGTGKGVFSNNFGGLFSPHFTTISNGEHLVGKFNGHLSNLLLLCVDEAFWSEDPKAEGILKNLVTEPKIMIERKGYDPQSIDSYLRVIMTTNNEHAVPASNDERRWGVLDCAPTYKGKSAYFKDLQERMDDGGREALLHYLMTYQIPVSIDLRNPPVTKGLNDQKIHSLSPMEQWWMYCLDTGELSIDGNNSIKLSDSSTTLTKASSLDACLYHMKKFNLNYNVTRPTLGKYLNKVVSNLTVQGPSRSYVLPGLKKLRSDFEREIGPYDWG